MGPTPQETVQIPGPRQSLQPGVRTGREATTAVRCGRSDRSPSLHLGTLLSKRTREGTIGECDDPAPRCVRILLGLRVH